MQMPMKTLRWHWLSMQTPQEFTKLVELYIANGFKADTLTAEINLDYLEAKSQRLKRLMTPIKSVEIVLCRQ